MREREETTTLEASMMGFAKSTIIMILATTMLAACDKSEPHGDGPKSQQPTLAEMFPEHSRVRRLRPGASSPVWRPPP